MPGHSAAPPQLIVTTGPDAGRAYAVPAGYCEIGRLAGSGIRLDAEGVSRRHAAMNRAGSHVVLSDLGSTNGTYLNGTLLDAPRPLRDGDLLRIGHVELRLSVEAARHGPAHPGDPEDGATEERGEDPGGAPRLRPSSTTSGTPGPRPGPAAPTATPPGARSTSRAAGATGAAATAVRRTPGPPTRPAPGCSGCGGPGGCSWRPGCWWRSPDSPSGCP